MTIQATPVQASRTLLDPAHTLLMVVDIQEKLMPIMRHADELVNHVLVLLAVAQALRLPVVVTEQYPKGLGPTVEPLRQALAVPDMTGLVHRFEKTHFGCLGDEAISAHLRMLKGHQQRHQVVVCGMETHVCIHQTTQQLLVEGFDVHLIQDAIVARRKDNHKLAMTRMLASGAVSSGMETMMFELLRTSLHPSFKALQALVKER